MITYSQKTEDCIHARYSIGFAQAFLKEALQHLDGKFNECPRLQNIISELDVLHLKVQCVIDKFVDEEMRYEL